MAVNYWEALAFSFMATAGFAVLFQAPRRSLAISGVIGAIGWIVFVYLRQELGSSSFYANLAATIVLSLLSEVAARLFKQPVTVFVIPGIIPIVPGLGMYNGMAAIIEGSYDRGVSILLNAGLDAGAIALGMMLMTSVFRVLKISKDHRLLQQLLHKEKQGS